MERFQILLQANHISMSKYTSDGMAERRVFVHWQVSMHIKIVRLVMQKKRSFVTVFWLYLIFKRYYL